MEKRANIKRDRLICLGLLLAVAAAYWPVRQCGFVSYDDPVYITANPAVQGGLTLSNARTAFSETPGGLWIPLVWLSLMAGCGLYGLDAGWHHLTNVMLHGAGAVLLFLALRRMTGAVWRSAMVAALFGLHPLHVESVAWVTERKDVLSGVFWMLSLLAYGRYAGGPSLGRYLWVAVWFVMGLMSKPMVVTLPLVLLLLDGWPLGRLRRLGPVRLLLEKVPLLALSAACGAVTFWAQRRAGAVVNLETYSAAARLANAAVSYADYMVKMVWPRNLAVLYPHPGMPPWGRIAGALLLLAGISAAAAWCARCRRAYLAMGWLWYLVVLLPVIGLVQVGPQAMADRFVYLPLIGIYIAVVWGAAEPARQWSRGPQAAGVCGAAVLVLLGACTWRQAGYWKDSSTLFTRTLEVTENNPVAHNSLGFAFAEAGRLQEAIHNYQAAIAIQPGNARAHNNLANALTAQGRSAEALAHFRSALRIDPGIAEAHNNLGYALARQGRLEEAVRHYREALNLRPGYAKAHHNLGEALAEQGRMADAVVHLRRAVALAPGTAGARNSLGVCLARRGLIEAAVDQFEKAIQADGNLEPARENLKQGRAVRRQAEQALQQTRSNIARQPEQAGLQVAAGNLCRSLGDWGAAADHYSEALKLDPVLSGSLVRMDVLEGMSGGTGRALRFFRQLADLEPGHAGACYAVGSLLALRGEPRAALGWLARAAALDAASLERMRYDVNLDAVREEPGYRQLMRTVPGDRPGLKR